jgi:Protein kinase domain
MGAKLAQLPGARATASDDPEPVRLGRYRLLQPIGEGGMAVVHLAVGPDDRMVAVKALRRPDCESADARCRLAREVRALRRVSSPFVAEVIDADVKGSIPYIVMKLVQGRTLAQMVAEQGPLCGSALQRLACAGAGPYPRPAGRHKLSPLGPPYLVETDASQLPASAGEREAPPLHGIKVRLTELPLRVRQSIPHWQSASGYVAAPFNWQRLQRSFTKRRHCIARCSRAPPCQWERVQHRRCADLQASSESDLNAA